ncbi:MAG TPA: hypothetical protein VFP64_04675 [Pyrinomonadaceae bacterium]|nr:hypothetical protein [Pyrinomonadaceae bacterium]
MSYILGTLSDEEKARLEEGYFVDDAEFEEFEIAEEELIDRYVRGELSQQESDQLEKTFARSPRLIQRVQIARVLANRLAPEKVATAQTPQPRPARISWWQSLFGFSNASRAPAMAVGFSVLLLLLGGVTLLMAYVSLREQSRQVAAQQAALEQRQRELDRQAAELKAQTDELARQVQLPSETPAPPQVTPTPQAAAPVVFLTLSAGVTRSVGGSKSVRLGPETSEVQLTLGLRDTSYPSYRATVINADRGEVFSKSGLRPQAARLTLRVPTKQLPPGDYYVSVYGGPANESVADYPFRVTK